MPVRGIDVIEGIPVYLKGNVMYAFRHEAPAGQPVQAEVFPVA